MNGNKEDVLGKIVKLLALADPSRGGTASEVETAMRLANKLMADYNITMGEVTKNDAKVEVQEVGIKAPKTLWKWEKRLAWVFVELCEIQFFMRRSWSSGDILVFVGTPQDVAIATSMYDIFRKQIHSNGRKYPNHADHRSYGEGYVSALHQRAKELHTARAGDPNAGQALIFVGKKTTAIREHLSKYRLHTQTHRKHANVTGAYYDGVRDGNEADIGTKRRLGE